MHAFPIIQKWLMQTLTKVRVCEQATPKPWIKNLPWTSHVILSKQTHTQVGFHPSFVVQNSYNNIKVQQYKYYNTKAWKCNFHWKLHRKCHREFPIKSLFHRKPDTSSISFSVRSCLFGQGVIGNLHLQAFVRQAARIILDFLEEEFLRGNVMINIPILPIGNLDFCKQKLWPLLKCHHTIWPIGNLSYPRILLDSLKNVVCYRKDKAASTQFLPSPCGMDITTGSLL